MAKTLFVLALSSFAEPRSTAGNNSLYQTEIGRLGSLAVLVGLDLITQALPFVQGLQARARPL